MWFLRYMDGDVQRSDILATIHKFETMVASPNEAASASKKSMSGWPASRSQTCAID